MLAEKAEGFVSTFDAGAAVPVGVVAKAEGAAVFGDPKENIPLPTLAGLLSSVIVVAAVAIGVPKLKEELAGAMSVVLVVVAPLANAPKVTVGFFCSMSELVLLVVDEVLGVTTAAGCANEKPVFLIVSTVLLAGEPKLNPLVVVEVTVSELFVVSDVADLEPKLNPPGLDGTAAAGGPFLSFVLELSVVSDDAAGLIPKLNPLPVAGAAIVAVGATVPLFPKLNLGLSFELVVLVVDVTDPKLKPVLVEVVGLVDELAGTPKENSVVLGASFPSESGTTPKLSFAVVDDGLLPKEKDGAFSGVEPGLACSQQAHLDREASFRVIQALHSHLLADCCATSALKP